MAISAPSGVAGWQKVLYAGFSLWLVLFLWQRLAPPPEMGGLELLLAVLELVASLAILQGACEAFILSVERLGARLRWEGFIAGTVGSIVATLPEFVVIALLVQVDAIAAFLMAIVTIYNNALIFSVYSFFLPKDHKGKFLMPRAITKAGGEVLIAGSGITLILGLVMLALRSETHKTAFAWQDLFFIAAVLFVIFGYYLYTTVKYYAEAPHSERPADPHTLGHPTGWGSIASMFGLGVLGAVLGGESVSSFADTALHSFQLPKIPTALGLSFFAGISEYVIVYKAHRRGQLGIALSNVFGGITQVMFLVVPFTLLVIGLLNYIYGSPQYAIPINFTTTILLVLLFPLFFVLFEYIEEDHTLSNLDAVAMTGIYLLLLYFLIFTGKGAS